MRAHTAYLAVTQTVNVSEWRLIGKEMSVDIADPPARNEGMHMKNSVIKCIIEGGNWKREQDGHVENRETIFHPPQQNPGLS